MWVRIARQFDYWFEPRILALYRVTEAGVSGSMRRSAADMHDVMKAVEIMAGYLPPQIRDDCRRAALESHAIGALEMARAMYLRNDPEGGANQMKAALSMSKSPKIFALGARIQLGRLRRMLFGARAMAGAAGS